MDRKNFFVRVDTSSPGLRMELNDRCLLLGSCFAQHVGGRMAEEKLHAVVNPFGVLYNPESIFRALDLMAYYAETGRQRLEETLFETEGTWRSWLFSTEFSYATREECLERLDRELQRAADVLNGADLLMLTFGTNHVYRLRGTNHCVANCHKQSAALFEERELTVDEIVDEAAVLRRLMDRHPGLNIVMTVSPYRYAKYGFHGSQLSKATLLLSVERMVKEYAPRCHYFPAYELLMDELRDYRFYAADMLHPSEQAVDYVWQRFREDWMTEEARQFISEWEKARLSLAHRPISRMGETYRRFLENLQKEIDRLQRKYPNFAFQTERAEVRSRLDSLQDGIQY